MKRAIWIIVAIVSLTVTTYASIFVLAEIFTEVVVLRTYDSSGDPHDTRVTVVDIAGTPWVRGRPYRGWFRRIEANSTAELRRGNVWLPVRGEISRDPADAAAFEHVMLENYGLLYRCLDLIARMSSNEIPVRLVLQTHSGRPSNKARQLTSHSAFRSNRDAVSHPALAVRASRGGAMARS